MSIVDKLRSNSDLNAQECLLLCSMISGMSDAATRLMFGDYMSKDRICQILSRNEGLRGIVGFLGIYSIDRYSVDILGAAVRNVTPTKYSTSAAIAAFATGLIISLDPDGDMLGVSGTIRELAMTFGVHAAWEQYALLYADGQNNNPDKLMVQFLVGSMATVSTVRAGVLGEGVIEFIPDTMGNIVGLVSDSMSYLTGGTTPADAVPLLSEAEANSMLAAIIPF
jgi:hypothetical protein